MASQPVPVIPVVSELQTIEKKFGVFLTAHHIILYVLLAAALFTGLYLFEDARISAAQAKAHEVTAIALQAKQDAADSSKNNAVLQAQITAQINQLQASNKQLADQNEALTATVKAELAALAAQKKVDASMSPTQQSQRWQVLVPKATVTPTTSGFAIDAAGGLTTVQQLEELPVDREQIAELTTSLANDDKIIADDAMILSKEQAAHSADLLNDGKQLMAAQDQTKKVQADFTLYKRKAHRNILRAFAAGVVTGFALRKILGF